jgi:hypothetical protein
MALTRASSEEEFANLALGRCKEDEIATFDDDVNRARVVRRHFGLVRDALLRRLDWNFASTWTQPAADALAGVGTFVNRYPLPSECIAVRAVFDGSADVVLDDDQWAVEGGRVTLAGADVEAMILVCNSASALIRFTRRVESPRLWDPLFSQAFICLLAAACAPELGRSMSQANALAGEAESILVPLAKRVDAKEKAPSKVGGERLPSWIAARAGFRSRRFWW